LSKKKKNAAPSTHAHVVKKCYTATLDKNALNINAVLAKKKIVLQITNGGYPTHQKN
jgi:hypothetical protein